MSIHRAASLLAKWLCQQGIVGKVAIGNRIAVSLQFKKDVPKIPKTYEGFRVDVKHVGKTKE